MEMTLSAEVTQGILARLGEANRRYGERYPGESASRQPVHTVYGGGHLFRSDTAPKLGQIALRTLRDYAPRAAEFGEALDLDLSPEMTEGIYDRIVEKLMREPVEDFRIDFEDGYGNRPDAEEDGHVVAAAQEVIRGREAGTLPPFIGIRIKPFTEELRGRGIRTLDLFLTTLAKEGGPRLPENLLLTLPKVTIPEQAAAMAEILERLEEELGLPARSLRFELMIETPASIFGADGTVTLPRLLEACRGRCAGAHFGTYDYTAGCNITAAYQDMAHPACDFAKHVMQIAFAGTGVPLSDGATNVMPVPVHRGESLTPRQAEENRRTVHDAWRLHYRHVRHSLRNAFYQGWDLHPGQLPTRYAAVYAFFRESLAAASERLRNFVSKAAQATLVGEVFDDAATGQGLLNFFLRGINCGAISEEEALATGLTPEEIRGRSFVAILKNRRG